MEKLNLFTPNEFENYLGITKEEADRALVAYKNGNSLCYEKDGKVIIIDTDGTMYVNGFVNVFGIFSQFKLENNRYLFDCDATYAKKIKGLVKKIVFEEGTEWLGATCKGFGNLKEVVIPSTVKIIYNAFEDCKKLKPYKLPSGIKEIHGPLYGIYEDNVVLPDGIEKIGNAFEETSIKSIVIPGSCKCLDSSALAYCKELESITLGEGVEEIGRGAFKHNSRLNNIVFPKSLKYIASYAFSGCTSLANVTLLGNTEIHNTAFMNTPCENKMQELSFAFTEAVEFEGDTSSINYYDMLVEKQQGKSLTEQARSLGISYSSIEEKYSYGDTDSSLSNEGVTPLLEAKNIDKLILKNGIIVGVVINDKNVMLGECICTYYAVDEDGTGRDEVCDYHTLIIIK